MIKAPPTYVSVNRNFLNYPIARDIRCETVWRRLKRGCWLCKYVGDRIRVYLPDDVDDDLRRCPTGFDMSVLWLLIAVAQMRRSRIIEFASLAEILRLLGASINTTNREKLDDALHLWSQVSIRFTRWYSKKRDEFGSHHCDRKFLPPIKSIDEFSSDGRRITIRDDWMKPDHGYYVEVPIPLPSAAAAQNLVLFMMTAISCDSGDGRRLTNSLRRRDLCRIVGLNHGTRNGVLANAIKVAEGWFKENGGSLDDELQDELIRFAIKKPEPCKPKQRKSLKRARPKKKVSRARIVKPKKAAKARRSRQKQYPVVHKVPGYDAYGDPIWVWLYEDGRPVEDDLRGQIVLTEDGIDEGYLADNLR